MEEVERTCGDGDGGAGGDMEEDPWRPWGLTGDEGTGGNGNGDGDSSLCLNF